MHKNVLMVKQNRHQSLSTYPPLLTLNGCQTSYLETFVQQANMCFYILFAANWLSLRPSSGTIHLQSIWFKKMSGSVVARGKAHRSQGTAIEHRQGLNRTEQVKTSKMKRLKHKMLENINKLSLKLERNKKSKGSRTGNTAEMFCMTCVWSTWLRSQLSSAILPCKLWAKKTWKNPQNINGEMHCACAVLQHPKTFFGFNYLRNKIFAIFLARSCSGFLWS